MAEQDIIISRKTLTKAFDLADAWNKPDGTSTVQDDFERVRYELYYSVISQQGMLDLKYPSRDDGNDNNQCDAVLDGLHAYMYGDVNGARPARTAVIKAIEKTGIIINQTETEV